jgi:hypothetical protein
MTSSLFKDFRVQGGEPLPGRRICQGRLGGRLHGQQARVCLRLVGPRQNRSEIYQFSVSSWPTGLAK